MWNNNWMTRLIGQIGTEWPPQLDAYTCAHCAVLPADPGHLVPLCGPSLLTLSTTSPRRPTGRVHPEGSGLILQLWNVIFTFHDFNHEQKKTLPTFDMEADELTELKETGWWFKSKILSKKNTWRILYAYFPCKWIQPYTYKISLKYCLCLVILLVWIKAICFHMTENNTEDGPTRSRPGRMSRTQVFTLISVASVNFGSMICYSILAPFFPHEVSLSCTHQHSWITIHIHHCLHLWYVSPV